MFAIEVQYKNQSGPSQSVLMRRPLLQIGPGEDAHIVIPEMKQAGYQYRVSREAGRRFRCSPLPLAPGLIVPDSLEGVYQGDTVLEAGDVKIYIAALDSDLGLKEAEPPDRAGVRVLRQAGTQKSPKFPALMVKAECQFAVSFTPGQALLIGRGPECAVRIDTPEVSTRHARIGFESGQFWIEDLGSTNGTFVAGQQISGRTLVAPGSVVTLARNITLTGVLTEDQLSAAGRQSSEAARPQVMPAQQYPALVSVSEVARPARLPLSLGSVVRVGRSPNNELWLGAPHISRSHCEFTLSKTGVLTVNDFSTNGTLYDDGILRKGNKLEIPGTPKVFDFGGGVTLAVCFTAEQEQLFSEQQGSARTFKPDAGSGLVSRVKPAAEPETLESVVTYAGTAADSRAETPELSLRDMFGALSLSAKMLAVFALLAVVLIVVLVLVMLKPLLF